MKRFTAGLLLGSTSSGIAYACGATPLWTALIGAAVALVVWFGKHAVDFIGDVLGDLF